MDVPAIATGFTPISSSASMTAMCASPRAPPPPSASAKIFIGLAASRRARLTREFPRFGGERLHEARLGPRDGTACSAVAYPADDALQDRRDAKEIVGRIHPQIGAGSETCRF